MSLPPNPFPGPVPLTEKDQIFGREREKKELIDRLIADRLVLLYSPSGAGKSSLLNAGVLQKMRERKYRTHKPIRVGYDPPAGLDVNRYEWSCANSLEIAYTGQSLSDIFGQPARDLFIFDQFEEVITRAPGKPEHRLDFFKHLGEALRVPGRWAIFAIREDYLAPVQEYLEWLPTQLASSMRLNILNMEDARKSILRPIEESKAVTFEEGALDALLADLARDGWVEPVQLQVVCKDLWEQLDKKGLTKITKTLVTESGSAELALEKYYGNVVQRIAASDAARKSGVTERAIRNWFGESLISASNTRLHVIKGDEKTGALPTTVVEELEHAHLVRSEKRGSTWCELTHDRLILPVTNSNRQWKKKLSLLQREAEVWAKERTPDHLLRGRRLLEGWRWAREHHPEMNAQEADYLRQSLGGLRRRVLIRTGLVVVFLWIAYASGMRSGRIGRATTRTSSRLRCAPPLPRIVRPSRQAGHWKPRITSNKPAAWSIG